jgi:hypothetical protein
MRVLDEYEKSLCDGYKLGVLFSKITAKACAPICRLWTLNMIRYDIIGGENDATIQFGGHK